MNKTPTKAEQREHLKKLRDIEKLIAGFEKSDADSMTFDRDQMDTIERAVACHDAVISLDMAKQDGKDINVPGKDAPDTNVGKWIPITEGKPKNGYCLWSARGGNVEKDFYWDGRWEHAEKYGYDVLAWQPLPAPFKEEDDE